ncbi:alpha/beta fold hydrolase [Actinoplanes bogorensis]|uniref:Alpha/beta fold hydrolase n=1 Tax=Paractinoplanes bogorensis TaxID=1610840 RepID=A0ABS5YXK1_9ACTN|nr:alpha/beta fold hydrolase [Actinoplanes bogorensis]MBU2668169.1 alpha/beta fold hydrolase [Actinoplanes bogorensis]
MIARPRPEPAVRAGVPGYVTVGEGAVHVRVFGHAGLPPLILLHDSPGSSAALAPMAVRLADRFRVVTIDLPGHGGTTVPASSAPASSAARTVAEVLETLGLAGAPTAGLGYGARVVAHLSGPNRWVARGTTPATAPVPPPGVGHLIDTWWRMRPFVDGTPADLNEVVADVLGRPSFTPSHEPFDPGGAVELPAWSVAGLSQINPVSRTAAALGNRIGAVGYAGGVHYRTAGWHHGGRPLIVLPPAPGSSTKVVPLAEELGRTRPVLTVDYPGHGRSVPLGVDRAGCESYADRIEAFATELDLAEVDVLGIHSGALLALLWQRRHPDRVRHLILDGLPLGSAFAHLDLDAYLPDLTPDPDGHHVLRAWAKGHDRDRATAWTADLLRGATTYDVLYRAVLTYAVERQPPGPVTPTLLLRTAGDPLARDLDRVRELLPHARVADATPATTAAVVDQHLTFTGSTL